MSFYQLSEIERFYLYIESIYFFGESIPVYKNFLHSTKILDHLQKLTEQRINDVQTLFQLSYWNYIFSGSQIIEVLNEKDLYYSIGGVYLCKNFNRSDEIPPAECPVSIKLSAMNFEMDVKDFSLLMNDKRRTFNFILQIPLKQWGEQISIYVDLLNKYPPSMNSISFMEFPLINFHQNNVCLSLVPYHIPLLRGTLKKCCYRLYTTMEDTYNLFLTGDINLLHEYYTIKQLNYNGLKSKLLTHGKKNKMLKEIVLSYQERESVLIIHTTRMWENQYINSWEEYKKIFSFLFSIEQLASILDIPRDQSGVKYKHFLCRYQQSLLNFWEKCYICLNMEYLLLFELISSSLKEQDGPFYAFLSKGMYDPRLFFLIISLVPREVILSADDDMAMAAESSTDEDHF